MQLNFHCENNSYYNFHIPDPDAEVIPGILWGDISRPFTPAFWRYYCITTGAMTNLSAYHHGESLREEVTACLLGGHGISGELGNAAYIHLKNLDLINKQTVTLDEIESALLTPLNVNGRLKRYRYPHQKAKYISSALNYLNNNEPPTGSNIQVRDWLTNLPGIGMKTASWVVRNWLDADDVAILDIHIHRAGIITGIFEPNEDISKSYKSMEEKFVQLAAGIGIPANILDNQIWNELRITPSVVRKFLVDRGVNATDKCGLPSERKHRMHQNLELFANN